MSVSPPRAASMTTVSSSLSSLVREADISSIVCALPMMPSTADTALGSPLLTASGRDRMVSLKGTSAGRGMHVPSRRGMGGGVDR